MRCIVKKLECGYHATVQNVIKSSALIAYNYKILETKKNPKVLHLGHFSLNHKTWWNTIPYMAAIKSRVHHTFLCDRIQNDNYSPSQQISSSMAGKTTRIILMGNLGSSTNIFIVIPCTPLLHFLFRLASTSQWSPDQVT